MLGQRGHSQVRGKLRGEHHGTLGILLAVLPVSLGTLSVRAVAAEANAVAVGPLDKGAETVEPHPPCIEEPLPVVSAIAAARTIIIIIIIPHTTPSAP